LTFCNETGIKTESEEVVWPLKVEHEVKLGMSMVRWMCGLTLKKRNAELREYCD